MKQPQVIIRHSEPNKYDQAPYGTYCRVIEEKWIHTYVQHSEDEDNPKWVHYESEENK
jgi:hypothetical protein